MNKRNIPFFENKVNISKLKNLNEKLNLDKRPYYLSIRKFNMEFVYELVNNIYNLQIIFNQPFILNKKTIFNILKNFLPYTFFLALSESEAIKLKKELKFNENLDLFLVIKKREEYGTSVFTYTNNFFHLNFNIFKSNSDHTVIDFFKDYSDFMDKNFYQKANITQETIMDFYGNYPVVLFTELSLDEALLIIYRFNRKHPNLVVDLMPTETRLLEKKEKIKWIK